VAADIHHVGTIDQLHDDVEVVGPGFAEVDDADDVRVVELGHRLRLALEAGLEVVVPAEVAPHDLDGDGAFEADLRAFVNRAHAALAEEGLDVVVAPWQQRGQLLGQRQFLPGFQLDAGGGRRDAHGGIGIHGLGRQRDGWHGLKASVEQIFGIQAAEFIGGLRRRVVRAGSAHGRLEVAFSEVLQGGKRDVAEKSSLVAPPLVGGPAERRHH
jgi:hypothetical protein